MFCLLDCNGLFSVKLLNKPWSGISSLKRLKVIGSVWTMTNTFPVSHVKSSSLTFQLQVKIHQDEEFKISQPAEVNHIAATRTKKETRIINAVFQLLFFVVSVLVCFSGTLLHVILERFQTATPCW